MLRFLDAVERAIALFTLTVATVLLPLLIGLRCWEIWSRKVLNQPNALFNYMEAEAFLLLVFLAIGYGYLRDAHVRVDILRERFSPRGRAWVELAGALLFMAPLGLLLMRYGFERAASSYADGERLALALGQPWRFLVHGALPAGMALFTLMALTAAARNVVFLATGRGGPAPHRACGRR